ncbi:MAG: DUF4401 domain-containing protein [Proteobacteria bacterium]|nr:DUF4401 domain-containing protein [Pseudomonadota bacterium]
MKLFSSGETPETFWQTLSHAGLTQGNMPADPTKGWGSDLPWFVKAMLGVAAWISSCLFLAFIAAFMGHLFDNAWVRALLGVIVCVSAAIYFRKSLSSVFFDQILFVLALLGQVLVLSAILDGFRSGTTSIPWLLAALFEAFILAVIPYQPNRFLSALVALTFLYLAAFFWGIASLFVPLCLALLAIVLHAQWKMPRLWPVVALALSLTPFFVTEAQKHHWAPGVVNRLNILLELPAWLWQAGLIAVFLGIVYALLKRVTAKPLSLENIGVWLLACLLAVGTWPVPLALFALAVFFLGFSQRDKLLEGIGIAQLLWSVGHYYYALQDTLLFKSLMLSALGAILLLLYAASRFLFAGTGYGEKT